jgi:rhamnogalacturonan endolyase
MRIPSARKHRKHPRFNPCLLQLHYLLDPLEPRRLFSLTHLYTFNDPAGADSVGTANATLFNGAVVSNGKLQLQNAGLTSNASTLQYARLPNGILPASGSATVEVWYNTNSATPTWMRVFDFGNGASGQSYLFYTPKGSTGNARAVIRDVGGAERGIDASAPAAQGYTNMAAVVVDASAGTLALYLNGALVSTTPLAGIDIGAVNETLAYLGRSQYSSDAGFSGSIDELRIYNEARSATTIAADKTAGPALYAPNFHPPRQIENLNRGLLAMPSGAANIYVNWRLLATDPANVAFNLYRSSNNGAFVKLNATPLTATTDFLDTTANRALVNKYFVKPVVNGVEQIQSETYTFAAGFAGSYLSIPLQAPPGGTTPDGVAYTYSANDGAVGDVDGDGQYEIFLKWDPSNSHDNSQSGYTGDVFIDCYKLNGQRLWRIDLGKNIRAGAHYTQMVVYDLDGDGRAELALRTAPGTIDGQGHAVTLNGDDPNADYRNSSGYILTGPEYLTIFNGLTGAAMVSTPFYPDRGSASQWGDSYGNRVDRFTVGVAYLDGQRPSIILGRGYYGPQSGGQARNEVTAWDYRGGQLTMRWYFKAALNRDNNINSNYVGQGAHSLTIGDLDGDGKDEVVYAAMAIDDDGRPMWSTGLGHGDALHLSDMDPTRPGLEIFQVHEDPGAYGPSGGDFRDARTGQVIYSINGHGADVGRGVAFDVDPRYLGYESWQSADGNMYNAQGQVISTRPGDYNFGVWWDADPLRELLDSNHIDKWNWTTTSLNRVVTFSGASGNNGTKNTPVLSGDILGDWREEVIERASDSSELRIYSTTIQATSRLVTLMQDTQYRESLAAQNSAYNQPPHPSFYLGSGMSAPPAPNVFLAGVAPVVQSSSVNGGGIQRSMVNSLVVTFNTVVSLGAGALSLSVRLPDGGSAPVSFTLSNPSTDGRTYLLSFAGTSLPDGIYDLTLHAAAITSPAGAAMLNDQLYTFHRLFADVDGNAAIDIADLGTFATFYNAAAGDPGYLWYLDNGADGHIDVADLGDLATRYGTHLTLP